MTVMQKKISALDLKPGMYVSKLDRPWREADVLFQGFYVNTLAEVEELQNQFRYVYVDVRRARLPEATSVPGNDGNALDEDLKKICGHPKRDNVYKDILPVEEELAVAQEVRTQATETVSEIMQHLRVGKTLKLAIISNVVSDIMESILRNPDAFSWLTRLKEKDTYTYSHAVDSCALAIAFGRHLGLPRESLVSLGTGALLFDVGKQMLPEGLLNKPGRKHQTNTRL